MAFVSELFDELRLLLNDAADTQVPFATKKLFLNRGIARMWPAIYRVSTQTFTLVANQADYSLPVGVADGLVISVELSRDATGVEFNRFNGYDIIDGDEDAAGVLRVNINTTTYADYVVRIKYVAPVPLIAAASYAASQSETWNGPDRAIGLPVLYAMSLISASKLDDRQDTNRYNTTQALNGVTDDDIIRSSQMWIGQFEIELAALERPLPPARD